MVGKAQSKPLEFADVLFWHLADIGKAMGTMIKLNPGPTDRSIENLMNYYYQLKWFETLLSPLPKEYRETVNAFGLQNIPNFTKLKGYPIPFQNCMDVLFKWSRLLMHYAKTSELVEFDQGRIMLAEPPESEE